MSFWYWSFRMIGKEEKSKKEKRAGCFVSESGRLLPRIKVKVKMKVKVRGV